MRQALRPNPQKRQVSVGQSIPAPIGGWDASSPLAAMPIENAQILDNWIPRAGYVELRRGFTPQQVGFTGPIETLMAYRGEPSGDLLFAASGGALYDVTTQGASPGAPVYSGATSNRWNSTAFANPAGAWLIACNGSDAPIGYNSGAWAALPALSGSSGSITLNPNALSNVFGHKGRLYYLEQGSLRVWNPAAGAVGGACTLLDLSSIFSKGGRLICGANWSYEFGLTADDFAVFMTDQGQLAVYQGIDPTSASAFSLIGVYDLGPPLGPRAMLKFGGDLAIVTADGVIPLSQGLKLDRSQQNEVAMTAKILNAFSAAVKAYGGNYGWQGLLYPGTSPSDDDEAAGGSLAIFNIPITTLGTSMQFVQNVLTGAWCRFLNLDAFCWELANGCVYFGGAGGVYQWDAGSSDNGVAIVGDVKSAFTDFGDRGRQKRFTMIRPLLNTTPLVQPALEIDVDYQESEPTAVPTVVQQGDTAAQIRYDWTSASGIGYVGAARMQVNLVGDTSTPTLGVGDTPPHDLGIDGAGDTLFTQSDLPFDVPCQLLGFDIVYEPGGQL
jgi:hypothetical protein